MTDKQSKSLPTSLNKQVGGNHYTKLAIQPAVYGELNKLSFLETTAIKYITRYKDKAGAVDLDKAIHCCEMLRDLHYGDQSMIKDTLEKIEAFLNDEDDTDSDDDMEIKSRR